jgi:penicillin-binding protein 1A
MYHPVRNKERSEERRNVVLSQMKKNGYLTQAEYDSLKVIPLVTNYSVQSHSHGIGTYFREYLKQVLTAKEPVREDYSNYKSFQDDSVMWADHAWYGWCRKNEKPNGETYNLYNDGLKIYTTINSHMQKYAEEAVREHMGGYLQPLFNKTKKGKSRAPYHWKLTQRQINRIYYLAMRRSERYRVLKNEMKLDSAAILENFNTPTNMTVFSWHGDIDTVMTPMDSIRYYKFFLHSGLMSMEPQTGYVRAYVGDINYDHFKFDNVMQTRRQVGSTFKPIIYTMAMMPGGFSPCHKIPNVPVTFPMPEGQDDYTPRFSSSERLNGKMITLKTGLAASLNQVSAWILKQYGVRMAVDLAHRMGIQSDIPEVPSICVGAAEIKLSEMVSAYGTYANQGVWTEPIFITRIEDKNGNILATFKPKKREVISEGTAYRMIDLMRGVVDAGTSTRIRHTYKIMNPVAGKTGTTNDNSDGWFIGMVPNLVTGVWVGGEERGIRFDYGGYGEGASMALPIWALFMQRVYRDKALEISTGSFPLPESMDGIEIDCSRYKGEEEMIEVYDNPDEDIY